MSPLRIWLRSLGVARVDWAFNYYSDTSNVHDVHYFDTTGVELKLDLVFDHVASYVRSAYKTNHEGAFSWDVVENDVIEAGGCKSQSLYEYDDQASFEVFWSDLMPQIRVAKRWTPQDGMPLLEALLHSDDPFVRFALKQNPQLPLEQKKILLGDMDEIFVRNADSQDLYLELRGCKALVNNDIGNFKPTSNQSSTIFIETQLQIRPRNLNNRVPTQG